MLFRIFISASLIFTSLMISDLQIIKEAHYFQNFFLAIFYTNCRIIFPTWQASTYQILNKCIYSLLFAAALSILFFGKKNFSWIFCGFSLLIFCLMYTNPWIDSSFSNFIHFVELIACILGILFYGTQIQKKQDKQKLE